MSTGDELALLKSRLDRLERRCGWLRFERWFWRCTFLVTLGIVGYLIMLESGYRVLPTPHYLNCETVNCKYVTSQGVLVNNANGQKRAVLGTADNGIASLSLWSPDDKILVLLGAHENGGMARFMDRDGKGNVWTGFYNDGSSGFDIEDAKGVKRINLTFIKDKPQIYLNDESGKTTFSTP